MATNFAEDATAGEIAQKVYDLATDSLMAHSIRAVEEYLRQTYDFDTAIVLRRDNNVLSDTGRLSWCSVAANTGDPSYIFVQDTDVDRNWDHSRKRFCIAHELYHVMWAVGSSTSTPVRNAKTESLCDVFANDLCMKHDAFYEEQAKVMNVGCRFQGLRYRTV
jgi:hypothetical protein